MAASEGEVSKGKAAFAYLLTKEIGEKMPGVVGEFLCEVVDARIGGSASSPAASATVAVAPPLEIAAAASRMIEAGSPGAPATAGGGTRSTGRKMSEATKAKIAATRAANKAARAGEK